MRLSFNMVPLVSFLAALRILTEAQSCNNGMGKHVFELVVNYRMGGSTNGFGVSKGEIITLVDSPLRVLQTCKQRCEDDPKCLSFDFNPGQRVYSTHQGDGRDHSSSSVNNLSGASQHGDNGQPPQTHGALHSNQPDTEYKESVCHLYHDRASPDGGDVLVRHYNSFHFNKVCLTSSRLNTECSNRLYVLKRVPGHMLEGLTDQETFSTNRTECEEKCINDPNCLSASYDRGGQKCRLSRNTKAMNPSGFLTDSNSDYVENMCLSESQACPNRAHILESGRKPNNAVELETVLTQHFQGCSDICSQSLETRGYLCTAFYHEEDTWLCTTYMYHQDPSDPTEETMIPHHDHSIITKGDAYAKSNGDFYRVLCGSADRVRGSGNRGHSFVHRPGYGPMNAGPSYGGPSRWGHGGPVVGGGSGAAIHNPSIAQAGAWGGGPPAGSAWGSGGWTQSIHSNTGPSYLPYHPNRAAPWGSGTAHSWNQGGYPPALPPTQGHHAPPSHPGSYPPTSGFAAYPPPGPLGSGHIFPPAGHPPPQPFNGNYELCKPGSHYTAGIFRRIGYGTRLRSFYIRRVVRAEREEECEKACVDEREFICLSFNFRPVQPDNCELSDQDSRLLQLNNPGHFEQDTQFNYYERDAMAANGIPGAGGPAPNCIDVSQSCSPDGMEFTMKTPEGFYGRIYTYGFYDSCFYDGNGGTTSVLRISRGNGFPRCGTQQYGDVMTNIVVVQFNDNVQTSRDKKYNLTCYMSGPGETVVTSSYMDTRTDGRYPTQIEHLPAQNMLTSNIVLRVLYRGSPTNTIAVGDLLTFRLEARGHFHYDYFSDIFATNVIAKDPYSGRQVHLIDSRGCPVDLYVFPELQKSPDGALQADFYAFKIPDSNLLVFQATVRTCRGPCEPVICSDRGRPGSFPSWGRKKRSIANQTAALFDGNSNQMDIPVDNSTDEAEVVHDLFKVFLSRTDMPAEAHAAPKVATVCVAQSGYYTLVVLAIILVCGVVAVTGLAYFFYRKSKLAAKVAASSGPPPGLSNLYIASQYNSAPKLDDPSEPIYTDPSLFEHSRSTRNIANVAKSCSRNDFS